MSNCHISIIYFRVEMKLVLVKADDDNIYFVKITFLCQFRSRRHDVIKLSIADISLIIRLIESQFGQRDEASPCDIEVI